MQNQQLIDHLFRHQYGKMVSILIRIFGLKHIELIEDAVQDTFAKATVQWRKKVPDNAEAWFTTAAKNRVIDLLRKLDADKSRIEKLNYSASAIAFNNLFEKEEIQDSELRMIFTACHPKLDPKDQIAFALKTIGGFSSSEIATALLLKPETVKKRLTRAKQTILKRKLNFELPAKKQLQSRLHNVLEVVYLIFNEGFHSNHNKLLVRKELCGEALRLTKLILRKEQFRCGASYALFSLLCLNSSRLGAKVDENFNSIDLKNQDRSKWYLPLINLGVNALEKANEYPDFSTYHIEAAIVTEHIKAPTFEATNWKQILELYKQLEQHQENTIVSLSIAVVFIQLNEPQNAYLILQKLEPNALEQRSYLFYGVKAKYYHCVGNIDKAISYLNTAIESVPNFAEKTYLIKKRDALLTV
ncbi:RNA polymerase sigma factor [Cellulophaga lytica]|uniref:Putative RNA polymerase, sigma-24 subunit, ECF subfamily n=1 Tax=Cellulophaga lytica (strain ATCC 23178 / DSM 7489 / JCM 8516 / NBRC 14961 / NCIMB 1423 / VKM B-1433 / Cy l20) TaxID=867900 RepID=F0RHC2_CELLC|nr:sigma-70 family RNA polymerase sigma factor [Cellulophaga lytica]ADY29162.1 putative RNA polymerase, sigma-24 subunit, ECF subfamily [Cellulophaga lytica DSM 7489]WQG76663.1 sigma-70 family RNA polymerase sigma factor [Cellulophaga lytica]